MIAPRLIFAILILTLISAGLVGGARLVGRSDPLPPTYLESGACDQPCWQGLQPGSDYIDHFWYAVNQFSPYSGHTSDYGDGIATMFELSTFGAITLGDVIREFGSPDRVGCFGADHSSLFPGQPMVMAVQVYFANGLVVADVVREEMFPQLVPEMRVRTVRYYAPGEPAYPIGETTAWHGFASTRRHYLNCHP
ncbi:MAG: hypothetical protein HY866_07670 [Chloroflexi bacterium]|nr:hypothetical protein [Chloroflexota bacterium]